MKRLFVSRKAFEDMESRYLDIIKNKNLRISELKYDKSDLANELSEIKTDRKQIKGMYMDLQGEITELLADINSKEKELKLAKQCIDKKDTAICEFNIKLIAADKKLENEKKKTQELEFCVQEANKHIKDLERRINVSKIAQQQLRDMCEIRDLTGKRVMVEGQILINDKVDGKKVHDLTMLLG